MLSKFLRRPTIDRQWHGMGNSKRRHRIGFGNWFWIWGDGRVEPHYRTGRLDYERLIEANNVLWDWRLRFFGKNQADQRMMNVSTMRHPEQNSEKLPGRPNWQKPTDSLLQSVGEPGDPTIINSTWWLRLTIGIVDSLLSRSSFKPIRMTVSSSQPIFHSHFPVHREENSNRMQMKNSTQAYGKIRVICFRLMFV